MKLVPAFFGKTLCIRLATYGDKFCAVYRLCVPCRLQNFFLERRWLRSNKGISVPANRTGNLRDKIRSNHCVSLPLHKLAWLLPWINTTGLNWNNTQSTIMQTILKRCLNTWNISQAIIWRQAQVNSDLTRLQFVCFNCWPCCWRQKVKARLKVACHFRSKDSALSITSIKLGNTKCSLFLSRNFEIRLIGGFSEGPCCSPGLTSLSTLRYLWQAVTIIIYADLPDQIYVLFNSAVSTFLKFKKCHTFRFSGRI